MNLRHFYFSNCSFINGSYAKNDGDYHNSRAASAKNNYIKGKPIFFGYSW